MANDKDNDDDDMVIVMLVMMTVSLTIISKKRQSAKDSGVSWLQEMANELKFIFLVNLQLILSS